MRMVFGVVGLLLVLAIVGTLAKRSLQASVAGVHPAAAGASAAAPGATGVDARALPRQVADDVNRLMQQAPARVDGDPP